MTLTYITDYNGETVTFKADPKGAPGPIRVEWMDKWELCDALVDAGTFARVHHGPATYGHCTYYAVKNCRVDFAA